MKFHATEIPGVFEIATEPVADERGFFERTWCREEFASQGLDDRLVQCSASFNRHRGTLRGMHWQVAPHAEAKLVRVTRGAIHDVALDLRQGSPAFLRWVAVELSVANRRALFLPEGVAHGFQTLEDDSEVFYQMSAPYEPASARGARWNDPAFGITWPIPDPILSERDAAFPDFRHPRTGADS